MYYLEMSRDEDHGGGSWGFLQCLWAPTRKKAPEGKNGGSWPFWSKVEELKDGDVVFHLRGIPPHANFVGYSLVDGNGFRTTERPPSPGAWGYADEFYRAGLRDFNPFEVPINLTQLFVIRKGKLSKYFEENSARRGSGRNIFYVRQSGRLQCLNGAYLSEIDDQLFDCLFSIDLIDIGTKGSSPVISVKTGSQLRWIKTRVGQAAFSAGVKNAYGHKCCFPDCPIEDDRFLIGSHIDRWTDNEELRGHFGNGLCLCVLHDRAFELGIFTLDSEHRVYPNPSNFFLAGNLSAELKAAAGKKIRPSQVAPLEVALKKHWQRSKIRFP